VALDVLVVDDEPKIRDLLQEGFEVLGCRVRAAASGEEALRLVDEARPQLVLLDLKLEAMDGFAVLRELRQRDPALPVLVITGSSDAEVDRKVQELGALACVHKPLDLPALQHRVRELAEHLASPPR
jgi:CheY-like chemotaxis protein